MTNGEPVSFTDGPIAFTDGKAPDALRTIGEVASALGIRQHVLRYWEDQFPMLKPLKRNGGRRYYRPEDVRLVQTIDRLVHQQGFTLRGARLTLEGKGAGKGIGAGAGGRGNVPPPAPAAAPPSQGDQRIRLVAIRATLAKALAAA